MSNYICEICDCPWRSAVDISVGDNVNFDIMLIGINKQSQGIKTGVITEINDDLCTIKTDGGDIRIIKRENLRPDDLLESEFCKCGG